MFKRSSSMSRLTFTILKIILFLTLCLCIIFTLKRVAWNDILTNSTWRDIWISLTGIATIALAIIAMLAFIAAVIQVLITRSANQTDLSTELLEDFTNDEVSGFMAILDNDVNIRISRQICTITFMFLVKYESIYEDLSFSRRLVFMEDDEKSKVVEGSMQMLDDLKFDVHESNPELIHNQAISEKKLHRLYKTEFTNMVFTISNLAERAWLGIDRKRLNGDVLLSHMDARIITSYFVLKETLDFLDKYENYDFTGFRNLALLAQRNLRDRDDGIKSRLVDLIL